jgi:5'-nucleotidase
MQRKEFLKYIGGGSLALTLAPQLLMAEQLDFINKESAHKLTILHTNDQHSRIEPFDASYTKNPNQGFWIPEISFRGHLTLIFLVANWSSS